MPLPSVNEALHLLALALLADTKERAKEGMSVGKTFAEQKEWTIDALAGFGGRDGGDLQEELADEIRKVKEKDLVEDDTVLRVVAREVALEVERYADAEGYPLEGIGDYLGREHLRYFDPDVSVTGLALDQAVDEEMERSAEGRKVTMEQVKEMLGKRCKPDESFLTYVNDCLANKPTTPQYLITRADYVRELYEGWKENSRR